MSGPWSASQWRPLAASAGALLAALLVVGLFQPPDPYPFVILLLAMPVVVGGLVLSQRRQTAWLRETGAKQKVRSLPWPVRLLWAVPLVVLVAAREVEAEGPLPAVLFMGSFAAVVVLFSRLMR